MLNKYKHNLKTDLITYKRNMLNSKHKLYRLLSICLLGLSSSAFAATNSDENTETYVDSINEWGAWELGLEPAAGGPMRSTSRALTARGANVQFRPNDNSAFSPASKAVVVTTTRPTPMPAPISAPSSGPIGGGPLPAGGPGDRFR